MLVAAVLTIFQHLVACVSNQTIQMYILFVSSCCKPHVQQPCFMCQACQCSAALRRFSGSGQSGPSPSEATGGAAAFTATGSAASRGTGGEACSQVQAHRCLLAPHAATSSASSPHLAGHEAFLVGCLFQWVGGLKLHNAYLYTKMYTA